MHASINQKTIVEDLGNYCKWFAWLSRGSSGTKQMIVLEQLSYSFSCSLSYQGTHVFFPAIRNFMILHIFVLTWEYQFNKEKTFALNDQPISALMQHISFLLDDINKIYHVHELCSVLLKFQHWGKALLLEEKNGNFCFQNIVESLPKKPCEFYTFIPTSFYLKDKSSARSLIKMLRIVWFGIF